jgi:hypothetical protein
VVWSGCLWSYSVGLPPRLLLWFLRRCSIKYFVREAIFNRKIEKPELFLLQLLRYRVLLRSPGKYP